MFAKDVLRRRPQTPIAQVNIFNLGAVDDETSTGGANVTATATYSLASSGTGSATRNANWTWLLSGLNSDYQVRATLVSGTSPSGDALSSWLSLNTTRSWTLTVSGHIDKSNSCTLTIEIRRVVDSVIIDTAAIDIEVSITAVGGP